MGYPSLREIAVGRHYADKAVRFDHPDVAYLFLKDATLPEGLTRLLSGFDMIVSFLQNDTFAENLKRASRGYVLSHDPFPGANKNIHIIDHLLSALDGWQNVAPEERTPRVFLTREDRQWASDFLNRHLTETSTGLKILESIDPPKADNGSSKTFITPPLSPLLAKEGKGVVKSSMPQWGYRLRQTGLHRKAVFQGALINHTAPVVALHPGSGGRKKCWPVENFVSLALHLRKELDAQLFLVSGPADEDVVAELARLLGKASFTTTLHNLPLPKLAALLERCGLFVGNDSGVTHLAAATGVTTIALFGPTDPAVWGPRGEGVKIIQGRVACSPCSPEARGRCQRATCMESISARQVIEVIGEVLESICPNGPCHSERGEESVIASEAKQSPERETRSFARGESASGVTSGPRPSQ